MIMGILSLGALAMAFGLLFWVIFKATSEL